MITKVQQYQAAFDVAQQNLDATDPMAFEIAVPTKAKDLGIGMPDYVQFSQDARLFRGRLVQLNLQDKDAAAKGAAAAAKPTPAT